ncbi:hypothetical protein HCC61_28490 [Streptomyces sp. HNM0575]|nr:hypothetical protein [Streptomyces sp. HNM0575]
MVAGTLGALGPLGALTTLTGCSGDGGGEDSAQVTAADKRLRRQATRQSLDLLARYDATADAHSGLAERLRPLRAATMRHAEVLSGEDEKNSEGGKGRDGRGRDGTGPGDDGTGGGKRGQDKPRVPGDEKAALTALGDAEQRTARVRTAALVTAPPETARLLASLAAAGAAHAYLLGAGEGTYEDGKGEDGEDDGA